MAFGIERAKLELDKQRLALEKSMQRTAWLQTVVPVLFSLVAIGISSWSEYRRFQETQVLQKMQYDLQYNQAVSSYNQGRIELFKELTEHAKSADDVRKVYGEIFVRDSIILRSEQKDMAGK